MKSTEMGLASSSSAKAPLLPASTTKLYHTQPTTTTTTTAVVTQPKGIKLLQYSNPNLQGFNFSFFFFFPLIFSAFVAFYMGGYGCWRVP